MSESWGSPLIMQHKLCFITPKNLPQPNDPDFIPRILEFAVAGVASQWRTGVFSIYQSPALKQAAELLEDQLDYPLLVKVQYRKINYWSIPKSR